jgi:hypothetical protein
VNWEHFRTFLWLRWRLRVNQWRRAGTVNAVFLIIIAGCAVLLGVILFVACFLIGLVLLADAPPVVLLYVWDGLVAAFIFLWATGVLADLQRSEALSLDRFLHLPVSLTGAFLINYLSSLLSLNLVVFGPAMLGLSLGLILSRGPAMLLVLPLLGAFLLMVTALTYQFQGWLAALMANKRRRRTIIAVVTMAFVLLCQVPNLINFLGPWRGRSTNDAAAVLSAEQVKLRQDFSAGRLTELEYRQHLEQIQREYQARMRESNQEHSEQVEQPARFLSLVLPPGWLPLGAMAAADHDVLPALLGTLGLSLLGAASLWRSYRTTLRLYTGQIGSGKRRPAAVTPRRQPGRVPANLLAKDLPWVPEQAAAITLAGFRSLLRAPEAKMMLLSPFILVVVFGSMLLARPTAPAEALRPLLAFATMAMVLFGMGQIIGNQFGFDRSGFRVFVLCPARRRDILLGKNLAVAPLALGLAAALTVVLQVFYPMRWDHLLATLVQFVAMYLMFCLLANWLSIFAPMAVAAGSMRPSNARVIPTLLHLAFLFVLPIALGPLLLPLGVELLLAEAGWVRGWPICLALSLLECVAVVLLYRLVLNWQGRVLQARERRILKVVAAKAE